MHAIILFAHGSRDPQWHRPMQAVRQRVLVSQPDALVECAYLELSAPDLPSATQALVDRGATTIAIVPMLLGVGKHAREDLPALVQQLRAQHGDVAFDLRPAVGEDPRLIELLAEIATNPQP
jgi:sirohydrochlorin cobaltochelatase